MCTMNVNLVNNLFSRCHSIDYCRQNIRRDPKKKSWLKRYFFFILRPLEIGFFYEEGKICYHNRLKRKSDGGLIQSELAALPYQNQSWNRDSARKNVNSFFFSCCLKIFNKTFFKGSAATLFHWPLFLIGRRTW